MRPRAPQISIERASEVATDYTPYMSADTAADSEEIEKHAINSLEDIEKENEILKVFKQPRDDRYREVIKRCHALRYELRDRYASADIQAYKNKIRDYLQQELNVTFNMRDADVRRREFAELFFYYMWNGQEPDELIVWLMFGPQHHVYWPVVERDAECEYEIFPQFHNCFGDHPAALEYLIYKQPQLLFTNWSLLLKINQLKEHLPYDNLHQILMKTRDRKERTCMFYTATMNTRCFIRIYRNRTDDLFDLLSIRDVNGATALDVNPYFNLIILCRVITLNNQNKLSKLLTIKDFVGNDFVGNYFVDNYKYLVNAKLNWLKNQLASNNYPLYSTIRFLILYNTKNRPGAEAEAESMHKAFCSTRYRSDVKLEIMGTKREVIHMIEQRAADWEISALIVCVMSHGSVGTIEDSEGELITLTSIEAAMCSDQLKGRPKILIVQSCQPRADTMSYNEAGTTSSEDPKVAKKCIPTLPYEPFNPHFLAIQSCVAGQRSKRNEFIPYLAEEIINCSTNDHFESLVKRASGKVRLERKKQTPVFKSTLEGEIGIKDYPLAAGDLNVSIKYHY